jgi:hypothetical protein
MSTLRLAQIQIQIQIQSKADARDESVAKACMAPTNKVGGRTPTGLLPRRTSSLADSLSADRLGIASRSSGRPRSP